MIQNYTRQNDQKMYNFLVLKLKERLELRHFSTLIKYRKKFYILS